MRKPAPEQSDTLWRQHCLCGLCLSDTILLLPCVGCSSSLDSWLGRKQSALSTQNYLEFHFKKSTLTFIEDSSLVSRCTLDHLRRCLFWVTFSVMLVRRKWNRRPALEEPHPFCAWTVGKLESCSAQINKSSSRQVLIFRCLLGNLRLSWNLSTLIYQRDVGVQVSVGSKHFSVDTLVAASVLNRHILTPLRLPLTIWWEQTGLKIKQPYVLVQIATFFLQGCLHPGEYLRITACIMLGDMRSRPNEQQSHVKIKNAKEIRLGSHWCLKAWVHGATSLETSLPGPCSTQRQQEGPSASLLPSQVPQHRAGSEAQELGTGSEMSAM